MISEETKTAISKRIAGTILDQMGGARRIMIMTGAKTFIATGSGVRFKVGRKIVDIQLNSLDLYDVIVGHSFKGTFKPDHVSSGIYCDMLKGTVEKMTGYALSL